MKAITRGEELYEFIQEVDLKHFRLSGADWIFNRIIKLEAKHKSYISANFDTATIYLEPFEYADREFSNIGKYKEKDLIKFKGFLDLNVVLNHNKRMGLINPLKSEQILTFEVFFPLTITKRNFENYLLEYIESIENSVIESVLFNEKI